METREERARKVAFEAGVAGFWTVETATAFVEQTRDGTVTEETLQFFEEAAKRF